MSDPKRATLITVGASKKEKNKVNKTVRLTINLDESNESKYPELNYKELVIAKDKKSVENGKTAGLNPFSDNDDDVERVARKFEQKYGGNSTYGKKPKRDDYADIGAGYDENDSFIDNGHGYDEIFPPELETYYGGFYINSGLLEFKNSENAAVLSDGEPNGGGRRNKRRISSSSSGVESSDSSSDSGSHNVKEPKLNGTINTHKTEHRKRKNKEKKPKKIRRTDSSAATSGKQTSDDHAESVDSRTSHSDSLTSKPAPSSENPITSDSSRDIEAKSEVQLPSSVVSVVAEISVAASRYVAEHPAATAQQVEAAMRDLMTRLERTVLGACASKAARRAARAAVVRALAAIPTATNTEEAPKAANTQPAPATANSTVNHSVPHPELSPKTPSNENFDHLSDAERQAKIEETLQRLKELIEDRKPEMIANYSAECERVKEERKKLQLACAEGASDGAGAGAPGSAPGGAPLRAIEKRLPKRRFPWCARSRALLVRLRALARGPDQAARLLAHSALPLFPKGFVRMPTLLRQAELSKELKVTDIKRQRLGSASNPIPSLPQNPAPIPTSSPMQLPEQIHFPSSLTVTTSMALPKTSTDKHEVPVGTNDSKLKNTTVFGKIINTFSISKDLQVEIQEERRKESVIVEKSKEDLYIPPNNIGSITITPVPNNQNKVDKKPTSTSSVDKPKEALLRVKSPAALNEMVQQKEKDKILENVHKKDKDKHKKSDKSIQSLPTNPKDRRVNSPLHIETNFQHKHKELTPSPKSKLEEISRKQIESMRTVENNIPRPALVPVHLSPTFAKPDKRPPEVKKKKDIVIVSDVDPLSDLVSIDDSSSDVEVIEDKCEKSEKSESESVPSNHKSVRDNQVRSDKTDNKSEMDDAMKEDFNSIMKNLRDLENSQEPKFNNAFGGVISNAKQDKSTSHYSRPSIFRQTRPDKDKFTERASLNKMDGCSTVTG